MKKKLGFKKSLKVRTIDPNFLLVFDSDQDFFHEFNSTAAELFALFYKGMDNEQIVKQIIADYDIDPFVAKKEVSAFYRKLIKMGIANES